MYAAVLPYLGPEAAAEELADRPAAPAGGRADAEPPPGA